MHGTPPQREPAEVTEGLAHIMRHLHNMLHPISTNLYVFEPPNRPSEVLFHRAGHACISPGRQERQGKIVCFAGSPQSKN
jgi:hypothetical protein